MNRGMLKSYRGFVPLLLLLSISGCTLYQDIYQDEGDLMASPVHERNDTRAVPQEELADEPSVEQNESNKTVALVLKKEPLTGDTEANVTVSEPPKETLAVPLRAIQSRPIRRVSTTTDEKDHKNFAFDLIQKGYEDNNTLFIIGGIQGDEPGGFMAASLVATRYNITKGSVWVIPNLNFYSIIKRSRGPFGDMNRKFASLQESDPDYEAICKIKSYIADESVKVIVNLHDGSGYYRKEHIDEEHSPKKWGQCSIVDQARLDCEYGDLERISAKVIEHVNTNLIRQEDRYSFNNTRTAEGNEEMAKTLTYFAVKNNKAAFGNEASKNLPTHERIYYHLLALEKYMDIMGIEFEREFALTPEAIKQEINSNIHITLDDNRIRLPLQDVRNILRYFPVNKDGSITYSPNNPLIKIIKENDTYTVYYGNRRLTHLKADYMDYVDIESNVRFKVDNQDTEVQFGDILSVKNDFMVRDHDEYRVNVIGFSHHSKKETEVPISKEKFMKRFSVDKEGQMFRVEFYKKDKFAGTVLVKFEDA